MYFKIWQEIICYVRTGTGTALRGEKYFQGTSTKQELSTSYGCFSKFPTSTPCFIIWEFRRGWFQVPGFTQFPHGWWLCSIDSSCCLWWIRELFRYQLCIFWTKTVCFFIKRPTFSLPHDGKAWNHGNFLCRGFNNIFCILSIMLPRSPSRSPPKQSFRMISNRTC